MSGARAFRVTKDMSEKVSSLGSDGPPLKTFVFEKADDKYETYTRHVIAAIWHAVQTYPDISLHRRLALLVPNEGFCNQLKPLLTSALRKELPHRSMHLISFEESLRQVRLWSMHSHAEEHMVLDCVENVDGLENLIVICIGLDAPIADESVDFKTRVRLYRALTRAQLLAMVVNEHIQGGFLEFLDVVRFRQEALSVRDVAPQFASAAAVHIQRQAEEAILSVHSKPVEAAEERTGTVDDVQGRDDDMFDIQWTTEAEPDDDAELALEIQESRVWDTTDNAKPASIYELKFNPLAESPNVQPGGLQLRGRSSEPREGMLYCTFKERPALLAAPNISHHGSIKPEADVCWFSFPGKHKDAFDNLIGLHHGDSVACVFHTSAADGLVLSCTERWLFRLFSGCQPKARHSKVASKSYVHPIVSIALFLLGVNTYSRCID